MTVPCDSGAVVYPAAGHGTACASRSAAPAMGTRFRLAMSAAQIGALAVPPWKKTVLRAMARYGMFVGDTGGSGWTVAIESGQTFWSFGAPDPMLTVARASGAPYYAPYDSYVLNLADGVDWARYLQVLAPCVTMRTC